MVSVAEVTVKYADTGIDGGRIFARSFGADEFAKHGLNSTVAQVNFAYRHAHGTLRGLHWQMPPLGEAELVRCTRGCHLCCGRRHPAGIRYLQ